MRVLPACKREDKQAQKRCTVHGDREHICFVFIFACVVNTQRPQIELHGWRRHYTGWYREAGISGVYLWFNTTLIDIKLATKNSIYLKVSPVAS